MAINLFQLLENDKFEELNIQIKNYKLKYPLKNFNYEIRYTFNYTMLHLAVLRNKLEAVKLLLLHKADPHIKILENMYNNTNGIKALYLSENFGKFNITKILKPYTIKYGKYYNLFYHQSLLLNSKKDQAYDSKVCSKIQYLYFLISKTKLHLPIEIWNLILGKIELIDL